MKSLVRAADGDLARGLEREMSLAAAHMRTNDAAEGLAAFAARRTPTFTD